MAKAQFPFKTGGGVLKKLIVVLVVLGLLAFVVKFPTDAAGAVDSATESGTSVLDSIVQFVRSLGNG
ncbi:hypothetical protein [Amycolatopsis suaedae]|uniref:Uncharacterized protein n=1 Tax=Amycolatopsis suaedae TaxID=2510978 RepID=A0A4Q7J278_9PSEU|nr:hypothetical protein [Amycolatopsis suaedae]RZQ60848.1 hypothetical protein EWH70_27500 [Amycolatopsis suaedae]